MPRQIILAFTVLMIIAASGCINGLNPESVALATESVKEFLDEYPNADVKASLYPDYYIKDNIDQLRNECGEQIGVASYWKVTVNDPDSKSNISVWINEDSMKVLCVIRKGYGNEADIDAVPGEEASAKPIAVSGICRNGREAVITIANVKKSPIILTECTTPGVISRKTAECGHLWIERIDGWKMNAYLEDTEIPVGEHTILHDVGCADELPHVCEYIFKLDKEPKPIEVAVSCPGGKVQSNEAIGFITLGIPKDWDLDSNGDFSISLSNDLLSQITITKVEISAGTKHDYYVPSLHHLDLLPNSFYSLSFSESGLNLGPQTHGASYSVQVKIHYEAGGLPHTESGIVTGIVSEATFDPDDPHFYEGQKKSITVEGSTFDVTLMGISDFDTAVIEVDDTTHSIDLNQTLTIAGLDVHVDQVIFYPKEGQISSAKMTFSINESMYKEGQSRKVTVDDITFSVTLMGVSDIDTAVVKVNEMAKSVNQGQMEVISGLDVYVEEVFFQNREDQISYAKLFFSINEST